MDLLDVVKDFNKVIDFTCNTDVKLDYRTLNKSWYDPRYGTGYGGCNSVIEQFNIRITCFILI